MGTPAHARLTGARIGLIGGESTGKSTLAAQLHAELGGSLVTEAVRDFTERMGRAPARSEQAGLMAQQSQAARDALAPVICDPAPLQVAVYSLLYFDDDSLLAEGLADAEQFDVILWCRPDLPWTAEPGIRDGDPFRIRADMIISERVAGPLAARGVPIIEVAGVRRDPAILLADLAASLTLMGDSPT